MRKVRVGDILIIDGVKYRVGVTSADAINVWIDLWESGHKVVSTNTVHLYECNTGEGDLIPASKIKAALENK